MIHVCLESSPDGAEAALQGLLAYQADVDGRASYSDQIDAADQLWENRRGNKPIQVVREMLRRMCPGKNYCMLCEDSRGSDVEHLRPKALYPGLVFAWANFLYACKLCNNKKGSLFKVYQPDGTILDVTRKPKAPRMPPLPGEPLLLDPRHEDPLELLDLDLRTGEILERETSGLRYERAHFTIERLGLNEREELPLARRDVYEWNESLLGDFVRLCDAGEHRDKLSAKKEAILRSPHRMVWEVMKRRRARMPVLRRLFDAAPEALMW